jgi:hypothetical protein
MFAGTFLHYGRYQAAFLDRDTAAMQYEMTWAKGKPGAEDILLSTQSDSEVYFGKLGESREFSRRALDSALANNRKHPAAIWQSMPRCGKPS